MRGFWQVDKALRQIQDHLAREELYGFATDVGRLRQEMKDQHEEDMKVVRRR